VKALLRCGERKPGGGEAQEGRGSIEALTGLVDTALSAGSKALKSRAEHAGAGQTAGALHPTARGHEWAGETRYGSAVREKSL